MITQSKKIGSSVYCLRKLATVCLLVALQVGNIPCSASSVMPCCVEANYKAPELIYLQTADEQCIKPLITILQGIQSKEDAISALPHIYQLGNLLENIYDSCDCDAGGEETGQPDFDKVADALMNGNTHYRVHKEIYSELSAEFDRLAACNFYNEPCLKNLIELFFVGKDTSQHIYMWFPGTRIRMIIWHTKQLESGNVYEVSYDANDVGAARGLSHIDVVGSRAYAEERMDLLFLNYAYESGSRFGTLTLSGERPLTAPAFPVLRGKCSLFEDCFCYKFCFCDPYAPRSVATQRGQQRALYQMHPTLACTTSMQDIMRMHDFYKKVDTNDASYVIMRLSYPFKSRYLILHYENERCSALEFCDELWMEENAQRTTQGE